MNRWITRLWADAFFRQAVLLLLLFAPLPVLSEWSGLDVAFSSAFYSAQSGAFPLGKAHWFGLIFHDGVRFALVMTIVLLLATLLLARVFPAHISRLLPSITRREHIVPYVLVAMLGGPVIVGLLKGMTSHVCPWSTDLFGGPVSYALVRHLPLFSLSSPGHCFPSGHASAGFALFGFVPLLREKVRWKAAAWIFIFGLLMSTAQIARGAHFLSHNLWSAWICWLVMIVAYVAFKPSDSQEYESSQFPVRDGSRGK